MHAGNASQRGHPVFESAFGQENKLTIITGKKLEYLGISIDYTTKMKNTIFDLLLHPKNS